LLVLLIIFTNEPGHIIHSQSQPRECALTLRRVIGVQPSRPANLRQANKDYVLHLLRANGPCSRADLSRISGLTAPTVSLVTTNLISSGLVEEMGEGASSGGRKPSMLRFNAEHGYVATADIGGTRVRMMLADLNGTPVAEWDTHIGQRQKTPRGVVNLVQQGLQEMATAAGAVGRVLHFTAGAPGITNVTSGVVLAAPNLTGWNEVPLRSMLEQELGIPVGVENDTNLAAVGEHAKGVARGVENFLFIAMGTGVGAGIFMRGALHHGMSWSAGEIGYFPVAGLPRQRVQMHETGQLERRIGGLGIEEQWADRLREEQRADQAALAGLRAPQIFDLAETGDRCALHVLNHTARLLADCLSAVALLYDAELIVLGGGVGSHPALCLAAKQCLRENDFALPILSSSLLGTQAQLFGGISLSLSAIEAKMLCS